MAYKKSFSIFFSFRFLIFFSFGFFFYEEPLFFSSKLLLKPDPSPTDPSKVIAMQSATSSSAMNSKRAETKSQADSATIEIRCKLEGFTPSKRITILNVLMAEAKRAKKAKEEEQQQRKKRKCKTPAATAGPSKRAAPESPPVIQALRAADDEEQRMKSVPSDVLASGIDAATMLQELVNCVTARVLMNQAHPNQEHNGQSTV
jgi:hypothetical protein